VDLATYLSILRRRALPLLLCVIAGLAGGFHIGHSTPKSYHATSRALVTLPPGDDGNNSRALQGSQVADALVPTYAAVAVSRGVAEKVIQQLQLPETVEQLQSKLLAGQQPSTLIIVISARDPDPLRATSIADATAEALSERVRDLSQAQSTGVQVQLLDHAAVPFVPDAPRPTLDLILGGALGLAAGLLLAAALEALDRTLKTAQHGEAAFHAPLLGLVPLRRRSRGRRELVMDDDGSLDSEPYRALRTAVRFTDVDTDPRSFLITSATPGEGKTTTAANLAIALAAGGESVVVVDADLRRAALAEVFGLDGSVGLSSLVLKTATIDEAVQPWRDNVWVLASGRPLPPNPSEVLGSHFMGHVISELTQRFDVVLIDTPPILPVTDAVALATQVDAVLIVARYGALNQGPAAEARKRLEAVSAHVIGFILNAVPGRETAAYYADYRYEY
jgi:succinoglycan biosynthesis transport protein ExoP